MISSSAATLSRWPITCRPGSLKLDSNGNRLYTFDIAGDGPWQYRELHQMSVDSEGNFYGADNILGRTQKFVLKSDVDPTRLIGKPDPPVMPRP